MSEPPTSRADGVPAETGVQALLAMIVTVAAGALAYAWGGLVSALVALLLAAAFVTVTQTLLRVRQVSRRMEGRRWVDVSGLSSEQAAKVLSALSGTGDALPMPTSEVLNEIARARERCKGDDVALAIELESLRTKWPRSPAVLGELARAYAAAGRTSKAVELYAAAIREGQRIGSFSWVLAVVARDELWTLPLELTRAEWTALANLARARGEIAVCDHILAREVVSTVSTEHPSATNERSDPQNEAT